MKKGAKNNINKKMNIMKITKENKDSKINMLIKMLNSFVSKLPFQEHFTTIFANQRSFARNF